MLSFDIRTLEHHPIQVDAHLAADDPIWVEDDPRPEAPVRVMGRLARAGEGRFLWSGRLEASVHTECRRCLTEVDVDVEDATHILFADAGSPEAEDPDVYALDPNARMLDLRPALREQWLLIAPEFVVCDEACKGLCPKCGIDRNKSDCACTEETHDPRWDALREARGERR